MRKILLMLCLLLGHAAATFADNTYVLEAKYLTNSDSGTASFSNGLTITNGGGQNYKQVWRN